MTETSDKEDEQWLRALAGQTDPGADVLVVRQAEALRRALKAQSERLDPTVPQADDGQFEKLLFRLRREGLTGTSDDELAKQVMFSRGSTSPSGGSGDLPADSVTSPDDDALRQRLPKVGWRSPVYWGLAATVVLGIGVVIQLGGLYQGQGGEDTLRGGAEGSTVLIVADPEVRLAQLLEGMKGVGEPPIIVRLKDGRITLKVKASAAVLDYLDSQRIAPVVKSGYVVLTLEPKTKKQ